MGEELLEKWEEEKWRDFFFGRVKNSGKFEDR